CCRQVGGAERLAQPVLEPDDLASRPAKAHSAVRVAAAVLEATPRLPQPRYVVEVNPWSHDVLVAGQGCLGCCARQVQRVDDAVEGVGDGALDGSVHEQLGMVEVVLVERVSSRYQERQRAPG